MASKFKSQENYEDRMKRQGFVKVTGWVPLEMRDEFLDIAEEMRKEALAASKGGRASKAG